MRRIYYAYAISLLGNPAFLHGMFTGVLFIAFTYFVSIPNVLRNILDVPVGQVTGYLFAALLKTEVWTLIILGLLIFTLLSLRIRLTRPRSLGYT